MAQRRLGYGIMKIDDFVLIFEMIFFLFERRQTQADEISFFEGYFKEILFLFEYHQN